MNNEHGLSNLMCECEIEEKKIIFQVFVGKVDEINTM